MEHFRRVVVFLEHNQYLPCSLYTTMLQYYPRLVTWQCTTSLGWYISSLYPTHNGSYEMQKLEHPFCGSKINFLNQHRNFQISIRIFKSTASLYSIANSTMHRLSLCYKQINMYIYGELNARQNDVLIGFSQVKRHFFFRGYWSKCIRPLTLKKNKTTSSPLTSSITWIYQHQVPT